MTYHLIRMLDDGRLTTPVAGPFDTLEELRAGSARRVEGLRGARRLAVVQVVEEVRVSVAVEYSAYSPATLRKAGYDGSDGLQVGPEVKAYQTLQELRHGPARAVLRQDGGREVLPGR